MLFRLIFAIIFIDIIDVVEYLVALVAARSGRCELYGWVAGRSKYAGTLECRANPLTILIY